MDWIIADNRVTQFLARFEPWQDGLVCHHDAGTGGLPCTHEEAQALLGDFIAIHRRAHRAMLGWMIVTATVMVAWSVSGRSELEGWQQALVFVLPFPLAVQQFRHAHRLPWQRFGRRTTVTPPRTRVAGFWSRLAALPSSLVVAMLMLSSGLAYQVFRDGWQLPDAVFVACLIVTIGSAALIIAAKMRSH